MECIHKHSICYNGGCCATVIEAVHISREQIAFPKIDTLDSRGLVEIVYVADLV